jgi:hypothetical protein
MRHSVSIRLPRAERRAAPKPVLSLHSPIALSLSKGGPARVQGPRRGPFVARGDRPTYSSGEGLQ